MINAGFNPLQIISEKTGKSISQLKEEMSKGAISAEMVQQAFIDATSAGGKFYQMSENASKTIEGQISMMQDAMDAMFNEIGTKTEGIIVKSISTVTKLIQNYEKIGQVLAGLAMTYGSYRTAVFLATAATGKHTLAEMALINVKVAARKAQLALNAAMLTNPYVALATVVAGLTSYLVLNADAMSANAKAHKEYNQRLEEATKIEEDRKNKVKESLDMALDDVEATGKRVEALDFLKSQYPSLFENYDLERLKLSDIVGLKREIAELDRQKETATKKERLEELDKEVEKAAAKVNTHGGGLLGKLASSVNQKGYEAIVADRDALREEIISDAVTDYIASLPEEQKELKALKDAIQLKIDNSEEFVLDGYALSESHLKRINEAIATKIEAPKYSDDYKAAKTEWETAKKELEAIEKDKDKYTTKQYEAAKTRKETAEKNFKKLGGDVKTTTGKDTVKEYNEQLAQQEKVRIAQERQDKERVRSAKDSEFKVEQARIDAMRDGAEKTRAQRALDNKRELEDLERQKQDYIDKVVEREKAVFDAQEDAKAKNDKTYKKQTFDYEASRNGVDTTTYDKVIAYTQEKQLGQQDEVLKALLDQYKSYEDKKQEIVISYLEESDELQAMYEETGDERYKRSLDERHKAYLQALQNLEKEMNTDDYRLIFGDPARMTSETIERALEKARNKLSQLDKEADPDSFKALSEAIERLENARDNNPFEGWGTSIMDVIQSIHQIRNIRKDIAKYEEEGNIEAKEGAEAQLEKSKKTLTKALIGTGVATFGDTLSKAAASMREVAEASGDIDLMEQAEALEKAGGFISSVASGAASGGWVGAIIGGASSLMDMLISSITETKVVAAEAKKAFDDYLDELAHKARTINEEDYETIFGVRALEKVIDAAKKSQKAYEDYQEALKATGTTYGVNDKTRFQDSLENMLVLEGKIPSTERQLKNLKTLSEKFPLLFDAQGNLNMQEAEDILKAYSKYSGEEWYKALEDAYNALEDYEKNLKIVDDYLTSLFSNAGSEIVDAIMQGNDALEVLEKNAGQIFKSIAKDMIMSALIGPEFIEKYKKLLRNAMATEGASDDADAIRQFVTELGGQIEDAQAAWEEIQRIAEEQGINMDFDESESQQTASSKGYETLSEDTGNELVGRATAQYESNLRMEESMRATKESMDLMSANYAQVRDIAAESRALIADSFLELQQIRENTGAIIKPIQQMSAKMNEWDTYIKSL